MLPPSTALFNAGSSVSGLGPICTERTFSPVEAAPPSDSAAASSPESAASLPSAGAVCSGVEPHAVTLTAITVARKRAATLFFIMFPP